jgi:hypothetical protein
MTNPALRQALAYADRGWPVFPCRPGHKAPATRHGYRDATTSQQQITAWFGRHPDWNLAIATGAPGPDVLDVDQHGPAGNGFPALARLHNAGLINGATACIRTPRGGLHLYYTGSDQRNGHLPAHHLDFRSAGGYVLAPPSRVDGRPYQLLKTVDNQGSLDWQAVTSLLEPDCQRQQPAPRHAPQTPRHFSGKGQTGITRLARWVAAQTEGNRNEGLFWAANRALESDPAADLGPLAAAARRTGLRNAEIYRTLHSARRTTQAHLASPDREAEGNS